MTDPEAAALARSRRLVLPELLTRSARRRPETAALIFQGRALSLAQLQDRVQRLACALAARGVVAAPHAHPTEAELIAHCAAHLAGYKKPSAVRFVDALPRNAGGKVLKRELRRAYGSPA